MSNNDKYIRDCCPYCESEMYSGCSGDYYCHSCNSKFKIPIKIDLRDRVYQTPYHPYGK